MRFGFGPDAVVLRVKDLDKNLTISSLEIPLAAWNFLVSQGREFLDNHLLRVPITSNQQGTFEMRKEVFFVVGAQDTDTRGYELSDLEDTELSWEDPAVDMGSVYQDGIDTSPSPSIHDIFQMGSTTSNPIIVDDEEDKENSAQTTTTTSTTESERQTEPTRLLRNRPFETRLENARLRIQDSVSLFLYVIAFDALYVFRIKKLVKIFSSNFFRN